MKKIFILSFVFFNLMTINGYGQGTDAKVDRLNDLTKQQKILLEERREIIKSLRNDFKASLSDAQKALLANDSMNKRQRREEFILSLDEDQKIIYRAMREGVREAKGAYRKSLSKDQKHKIMKRRGHKMKHKKVPKDEKS